MCMARAMVSTRARFSSSDSADRSLQINFMENHISKFNEFKESNENVEIKRRLARAIQLLIFHFSEVAEP